MSCDMSLLQQQKPFPSTSGRLPRPYAATSARESKLAAFVTSFQQAFTELYRHRRPLFILPLNEASVPKFVCCTIRPTLLPYTELYDLAGITKFVAEFINYEPLEDPVQMPRHLCSPASVLQWQAGDAFDTATLLTSLLLGAGYEAYVVVG